MIITLITWSFICTISTTIRTS